MANCPICNKNPKDPTYKPFCSKRCSEVDLQRWLGGVYVLPGEPADDLSPDDRED